VYHEYKSCGSSSIVLPDTDPFSWDEVDPDTAELLSKVWNTYGGFSAGHLRNMTHEETPWRAADEFVHSGELALAAASEGRQARVQPFIPTVER